MELAPGASPAFYVREFVSIIKRTGLVRETHGRGASNIGELVLKGRLGVIVLPHQVLARLLERGSIIVCRKLIGILAESGLLARQEILR